MLAVVKFKIMFLSIYKRFYSVQFEEHETKEEAVSFLERGSDEGELFEVAVYDLADKKIVWLKDDYLSKNEIKEAVDKALSVYHS